MRCILIYSIRSVPLSFSAYGLPLLSYFQPQSMNSTVGNRLLSFAGLLDRLSTSGGINAHLHGHLCTGRCVFSRVFAPGAFILSSTISDWLILLCRVCLVLSVAFRRRFGARCQMPLAF